MCDSRYGSNSSPSGWQVASHLWRWPGGDGNELREVIDRSMVVFVIEEGVFKSPKLHTEVVLAHALESQLHICEVIGMAGIFAGDQQGRVIGIELW